MGGERYQQSSIGPKNLDSLWRKQHSTHPLGEEIKTRFLCYSLRLKSLELKYLSFALRTTGSLTRSNGVVSTTHQWWSGTGISDYFFQGMTRESHRYRDHHGTVFLLWSTFLITEHKIAKKSSKLSDTTSIGYSTQCHLMFQRRLSLILIFWKQGWLLSHSASWPDVFFFFSFFFYALCTLRLASAWMLCIDWFLRGLWTVNNRHTGPCLRWKKPNKGERMMLVVEAYRRSWQSIHHR